MNSPDHTDRLLGLCHNQRPQQQQSALFPISGGAMPPPEMQMQMGGSSTTTTSAPVCQQPQLSLQVDCDWNTSAATTDPEDMNELSSLLVLYNHDLDRVQRHLDGALQRTKTQQDQLQLSRRMAEARKQTTGAMGDNSAAFVGNGAVDSSNSSVGGGVPETMMYLPNNQAQQEPQQRTQIMTTSAGPQSGGTRPPSSSSPGILSYAGTIKTALGPSQASSSLLGMAGASANYRSPTSLNTTGDDACSVDSPSLSISMSLGTQAQAQASYGVDAAFSGGANNTGMNVGVDANGAAGSFGVQQSANINHGMMSGLKLGRLTPPTHPSFQQEQQQQQHSNFSIGPSALMTESLTTPSLFDRGSIPSMPQNVLRSQSVGSVQSTISFASTGSASMTSDLGNNNRATGRMAGGGGFLGPGPSRALGPGGLGIKRAKRGRARSDGSNSSSIDASDSMAAKSNIQALLRLHASIGGKQPNAEGMCPIHIACRDYPTNARLIGTMLCTSPGVGRLVVGRDSNVGAQAMNHRSSPSSTNSGESLRSNTIVMEGSYPIHIALAYSANVDVVKLLVRQNPELLIKGDGSNRVPLSIAFSHGASLDVLDLLLGMNPNAAAIPDLRNNFPLHLACARRIGGGSGGQINLPRLKRLVEAFPAAVHKCNFNGKTPLELAQDGGLTDDDAISYLHEMAYMERDDDVIEAPDA